MMATKTPDRETFMKRLRASGLLSEELLSQAYQLSERTDHGPTLAQLLVEKKLITSFQARMLVSGRTTGFTLGQYRILDQIGRGGMGRVFKAEHLGMGRLVAIKVLSPSLLKTERARELFQHEVKVAARLSHPNIVTAFDARQSGERCFLVMEFVDGPNLQDLVDEQGPLPIGAACDLMRQAAIGLQYAYEHGMVHRDIKPANLLLQRSNPLGPGPLLKILDFGLARLHEPHDDDEEEPKNDGQAVMGTPDYLSPEQGRNLHHVDIRSDLYSLGCTFYFILTGQPPFPGGRALEKLVRHYSEDPQPIREVRSDIPDGVAEIVHRLLSKNPLERHQSPVQLALELVPFSIPHMGFLMPSTDEGGAGSDESINLGGTWPGHDTALALGSSASFLFRNANPAPRRKRWDWLQVTMLVLALALGFVMGAGFLAIVLLLRSRGD